MKQSNKDLSMKIQRGISEGVKKAVAEHKNANREIAVWENGRVVRIPPDKISV